MSSTAEHLPCDPHSHASRVRFAGTDYVCNPSESVLDALLRQGVEVPYSCKRGVCLTCQMRALGGDVPAAAQAGLRQTARAEGFFLACMCRPGSALEVALPEQATQFQGARVIAIQALAPAILRVRLEPAMPVYYHAGQFINLRRYDGLVRSYSLASVPHLDDALEIHVRRLLGGAMSSWIFDELAPGARVELQGPNGSCYYLPGNEEQPLLLVGNGSGLGPLMGIARDALASGHRAAIWLYHGSRWPRGIYLEQELLTLSSLHANFHYTRCVSGADVPAGYRAGRAEALAFADQPDLGGWRVFLCGYPPMVHAAKKAAYLKGAAIADIHADPFELKDLRRHPRDQPNSGGVQVSPSGDDSRPRHRGERQTATEGRA